MIDILLQILPEYFKSSSGGLSDAGVIVGISVWAILFLTVGLLAGCVFCRKARKSVIVLENENMKGFNRLEIYRATVEKQSESSLLR
ncbi:MAG: hypothetical protein P1V20_31385 [Verrucomicrobiales bacterium]|nr:hypothetical protein [Verrucomicrobiales bacterium]